MKFATLKIILCFLIFNIFFVLVFPTFSTTNEKLTFKTNSESGFSTNANYKITLSGLLGKYRKHTNELKSKSYHKNISSTENILSLNNKNQLYKKKIYAKFEIINLETQVYFKGWVKYFKYGDNLDIKKPKEFFKNVFFKEQSNKLNIISNKLDKNNVNKYYL